MFDKVSVPLLGVVENMSYLEGPDGSKQVIFGEGGGSVTAEDLKTELFGQIPIDPNIREGCDKGIPIVISDPDCPAAAAFFEIARRILEKLHA
jgi:ATP-binding protein involved in chromosome partitioning